MIQTSSLVLAPFSIYSNVIELVFVENSRVEQLSWVHAIVIEQRRAVFINIPMKYTGKAGR